MKAALSLDLDNKWAYMKTHGDPEWERFPSYLDIVVPRALEMLEARGLRVTFFIVGQDAEIPANADALRLLAAHGHEIGNHSFHHEPWLHRRSESEIDEELQRAEHSIGAVTGHHPCGFRGPGFVRSGPLLRALVRRGYAYDASSLPTFIGPLARAYYFRKTKLDESSRRERADLFGAFADGFLPNKRHRLTTEDGAIEEIPVTTMPGLRVPIHISYVMYLAMVSPKIASAYFQSALNLCRITGTEPSILLHPLDFIDAQECPELRFFPAMTLPVKLKLQIVDNALRALASAFDVIPLIDFVGSRRTTMVEA
jgi:peptidoglycan-N-acetylglucosamine deacetylase